MNRHVFLTTWKYRKSQCINVFIFQGKKIKNKITTDTFALKEKLAVACLLYGQQTESPWATSCSRTPTLVTWKNLSPLVFLDKMLKSTAILSLTKVIFNHLPRLWFLWNENYCIAALNLFNLLMTNDFIRKTVF